MSDKKVPVHDRFPRLVSQTDLDREEYFAPRGPRPSGLIFALVIAGCLLFWLAAFIGALFLAGGF